MEFDPYFADVSGAKSCLTTVAVLSFMFFFLVCENSLNSVRWITGQYFYDLAAGF